jgi:hypothetical protein
MIIERSEDGQTRLLSTFDRPLLVIIAFSGDCKETSIVVADTATVSVGSMLRHVQISLPIKERICISGEPQEKETRQLKQPPLRTWPLLAEVEKWR